ncbi:uncharacterized protein LOC111296898 isoform X2 [Durio zibethinus]|uniref:Uncharacterized protein LOC111296898 isoform X2 n=1 Tax=Durio zibethinus TaxID=66656 RepID=A0A6P5Z438_DURZI|nr:uncharacterized protein LOC111296898 isoform X2 [Durio zibethinus]XP_022747112.1 uncharacterized protein LOC111296898 isoform X2 [Durio zibethinus]
MLDAMTFVLLPHYLSKLPYPPLSTYRLAVKKISEFSMEKVNYPEGKRDFMKEAECMGKEACESNPTEMKRLADDIMPHLLNLYGSCATSGDFEIYHVDASFEDPLMCAHGVKQIKSAFYSLSKVFSESRIVEYSVTEKVISSGKQEILIDNKQQYKFLGRNIDMISLIRLSVEDGKVVRHEDWRTLIHEVLKLNYVRCDSILS